MKTASPELASHLDQEVTTLATCWRVVRTDGVAFHFTDHDQDLSFDLGDGEGTATYLASSSYNRSAIKNTDTLAVDNLDLTGVLDSAEIDETELRRGLFDFATVEVILVNWADLSQGPLKVRRGWLGEVTITPSGYFLSELRGLTQAFSRVVGEIYSPECRADLGDHRCKIPIAPSLVSRAKAYAVGDYVKSSLDLAGLLEPALQVHADTDANDSSVNRAMATVGAQAAVQTVEKKFGAGAIEFSPSGSTAPSASFVSFPDSAELRVGSGAFTIECWVRFKTLAAVDKVIASKYTNTGNQRSWFLSVTASNELSFTISTSGLNATVIMTSSGAGLAVDTWYHVAVTRTGTTWAIFLDGVQVATASSSQNPFNSTSPLYLGKFVSTTDSPLDGFIDGFRLVVGTALYTSTFTPPTDDPQTVTEVADALGVTDYDDRIYRCTVAGTTDALTFPTYDADVGDTTVDGTATFVAEQAWSRGVVVSSVVSGKPRKGFSVTELLPSAGADGDVPGRDYFPDGSMAGGVVLWVTGANAGRAMEVRSFTSGASQAIELFLNMPFDIQVGDTATVYRGCFKRKDEDCRDIFDNLLNFRGEPFVPGQDRLFQYPDAKA